MGREEDQMNALVTGGGGFLGQYIVKKLIGRGDFVRILARGSYRELSELNVEVIQGDIRDREVVIASCQNIDVVFHLASKIGHWGKWKDFFDTNVNGTKNVLEGCKNHSVTRLIYTSSPSVVFHHQDLCDVDESYPYPNKFDSYYAATKCQAEQLVIASNGIGNLETVSLRPHLIWGPGDTHLIPGIIENARKGRLMMVGSKQNIVDFTYVENAADAHLQACDQLLMNPGVAGQVYFISQDEPVYMWKFLNNLLERLSIPKVNRRISTKLAYAFAGISEIVYRKLPIKGEPRLTRFLAGQLSCSHYFDISKAKQDLEYSPQVSTEDGIEKWLEDIQKNSI